MTVLFDGTFQHTGWKGGVFETGQFDDVMSPLITGLSARSFWMQSLNGQPIDLSLGFSDAAGNRTSPIWVNVHTNAVLQGNTIPSPQLIDPSTHVVMTMRAPTNTTAMIARAVVSDGPTTPAPTTPP